MVSDAKKSSDVVSFGINSLEFDKLLVLFLLSLFIDEDIIVLLLLLLAVEVLLSLDEDVDVICSICEDGLA